MLGAMNTRALIFAFHFVAACAPMTMPGDAELNEDVRASDVRADSNVATDTITVTDTGTSNDAGPPSVNVDPNCTDGRYTEMLPSTTAMISDVTFTMSNVAGFYDNVLMRRWANGAALVRGGLMNTSINCVTAFAGNPTTAAAALSNMGTVVHECGHIYDNQLSRGMASTNVYWITETTRFACTRGDTTTRGGDTFARSRIARDSYSSARPPCGGTATANCDFYADIYLNGNPDDAVFESGDQGFNLLFDEVVEYVNSLATAYAYADQQPRGQRTSARDGILNFMWYLERYLHLARTMYPAAYARISGDMCWRDAILTVWGRAWLYLEATRGMTSLGISDAALMPLVTNPELLDEIERLRTLSSCP